MYCMLVLLFFKITYFLFVQNKMIIYTLCNANNLSKLLFNTLINENFSYSKKGKGNSILEMII